VCAKLFNEAFNPSRQPWVSSVVKSIVAARVNAVVRFQSMPMSDKRKRILKSQRELIEHCFAQAIRDGKQNPVITIHSLSDILGKRAAIALTSQERVSQFESDCQLKNLEPLLITDVDHQTAISALSVLSPNATSHIAKCIEINHVPVAIIADGGLSWASITKPDTSSDIA
jgi:hypothetical protein